MDQKKVLVLNMGDFMQPLLESIGKQTNCEFIIASSVEDAILKLRGQRVGGAIVAFHPQVNPDTSMGISSGLEMWRRVVRGAGDELCSIPIVVTVESGFFNTTIEMQIKRYGIKNPYLILAGKQYSDRDVDSAVRHLELT